MEDLFGRVVAVVPLHIIAALVGSALGCWGNTDKQLYGAKLTFIMGVLTVAGAGALADFLDLDPTKLFSVFFSFLMGGFVGLSGMSLLDALRIASPPFTAKLVKVVSDTLLTQVVSLVADLFAMVRRKVGLWAQGEAPQVGEGDEPYPSVGIEEDMPPYEPEDLKKLEDSTYTSLDESQDSSIR